MGYLADVSNAVPRVWVKKSEKSMERKIGAGKVLFFRRHLVWQGMDYRLVVRKGTLFSFK